MHEKINVRKTLIGIIVTIALGFSGLCITGFFNLDEKVSANEEDHKEIRKELIAGDAKIRKRIEEGFKEFRTEQKAQSKVLYQILGKMEK